jgi:hypothetical protein
MTAFENYITDEMPRRPTLLTNTLVSYDGNPNLSSDSAVNDAPEGTLFIEETTGVLWQKLNSGAASWVVIGGGDALGLITTGSLHVYADGTGGDDNDDGLTVGTPKKTLQAAIDVFPKIIAHDSSLHLTGVFDEIGKIDINSLLQARLIVDGGSDVEIIEGPYTATGGSASSIIDSGRSWTVDEHVGLWIQVLDGAAAGQMRGVYSNDGTTLVPVYNWFGAPGAGDTFNIVQPATKIQASVASGIINLNTAPDTTYETFLMFQQLTFAGTKFSLFHIAGPLLLSAVVNRSTRTPPNYPYDFGSPSSLGTFSWLIDPDTYAFDFAFACPPSWVGSGGALVLKKYAGGKINAIGGFLINGGSVEMNSCLIDSWMNTDSRITGGGLSLINIPGMTTPFRHAHQQAQIDNAPGIGLASINSNIAIAGLAINDCGGKALEQDGGRLVHDGTQAFEGTGNVGVGLHAHSQANCQIANGSPPTLGNDNVEVSLDGTTEESTWAAIDGGTAINGATANNDEFVIVKEV